MTQWGFWERRQTFAKFGMGHFFTEQQIEKYPSVQTLLEKYAWVRGPALCARPTIIIDGRPSREFSSAPKGPYAGPGNWLPVNDADVQDIEIYTDDSEVPPEVAGDYSGFNPCGVVLVWTKY